MNRYCTKCQKEYDFKIKDPKELDNLICPVCGSKIDKNSRKPYDTSGQAKMETSIGRTINGVMWLGFFVYVIVGIIGVILFAFKLYMPLYILTAFSVPFFITKYGRGEYIIDSGLPYIVLGAIVGFLIFKSVPGICFGLMSGMILFQILKYLIFRLIFSLLRKFGR